jgi:hypothetical protein
LGDRAPSAGPARTRGRVPSADAGPIKKSDGLDLNPMFLKKNLSCLPCGGYHLGEILTKKFFQPWRLRHYVFHARAQIFLRPENGPSSARLQIFTTCLCLEHKSSSRAPRRSYSFHRAVEKFRLELKERCSWLIPMEPHVHAGLARSCGLGAA